MTSHDVVQRVRRSSRIKKVGHTGTLDPAATGVLVLLTGKATRLAQFFVNDDKAYRGHLVLGVTTGTQDADGEILEERDPGGVTLPQIESALAQFVGDIEQVPPMVSALKHEGTPLYVLARKGVVVDREPRRVVVQRLEVIRFEPPRVEFEIVCSSGTYVRTIASDVGELLGCGAHLGGLSRTRVGAFGLEQAASLEAIESARRDLSSFGLPMLEALPRLPLLTVDEREEQSISTGGAIDVAPDRLAGSLDGLVRITADGAELLAIGRESGERNGTIVVRPVRVFADQR
jgi:tRNA pseudouridine55 synthase